MSPILPTLVTLLLVAGGAYWTWHVEGSSVTQQLVRIEVFCAAAMSAFVILSPIWNATVQTAVHSGYRASTMFTLIPALALPAIIFPGAAAYALRISDTDTMQGFIKLFSWLLLAASATLAVAL